MKTTIRRIMVLLLGLLYLIPFALTLLGVLAPFFPVTAFPLIQLLPPLLSGLGLIHFIAFFFFLRRSNWLTFLSVLGIAGAAWAMSKDIRFSQENLLVPQPEREIRVVSLNVATFQYDLAKVDEIVLMLNELKPDLVAFQEFRYLNLQGGGEDALAYISQTLGLPYYRFDHQPENINGGAIFSRWPIERVDTLFMEPAQINTGLLVTLAAPSGPIGLANVHLTSYSLSRTVGETQDLPQKQKVPSLYQHGRDIVLDQQKKVDQIFAKTETYPYPLLIVGDFNTAPHSAMIRQFRQRYQDSFLTAGEGLGWSYPVWKILGLRIDYQFASQDWQVISHQVLKETVSDHLPILATYRLAK